MLNLSTEVSRIIGDGRLIQGQIGYAPCSGMTGGGDGDMARAVSTPLRQPDSAFTVAPQAGDERGRAIVTDGL